MTGHIQLGKYADTTLRDYVLDDERRLQAATANPYAARVSTGGPYAQLDTFNDWTIQDWHTGVGNKDPDNGQLFSFAESRYPNYLMLPPGWTHPLTTWIQTSGVSPGASPHEIQLLSGTWYSVSFTASKTANLENVWVLIHLPYEKQIDVALFDDNGSGKPGSEMATTGGPSSQVRVHGHWMRFTFDSPQSLTSGTRYHIVVSTDVPATLGSGIYPYMPTTGLSGGEKCHTSTNNGGAWSLYNSTGTKGFYFLLTYSDVGDHYVHGIYTYGTSVVVWQDDKISLVSAGAYTDKISGISIYDVAQNGNYLYVAYGTGWKRYDILADSTVDHAAVTSYKFLIYGGFLWRSNGNTVAYSNDETTWTTLDDFSNLTVNDITGMAGVGGYVYAATADGLFQVADGDQVVQVVQWPEVHANNGVGMVAWENALYIPLFGGSLLRYGVDGSLLNVGINVREELPSDLQGSVVALCPTNYFLLAAVEQRYNEGYSSLWAYNVDGWHCIGIGPQGCYGGAICADRTNGYLYWGLDSQFLRRTTYLPSVNNPVRNLADITVAPEGWVEYDRFYGGYRTLLKDFDRIYIDLDAPGRNVHVYWQTEEQAGEFPSDHDGEVSWQYLGTLATGEQTIQFPATSRPVGKYFKLALRLTAKDAGTTELPPVLRGVSLKYSTNVADRWRWVLPILVSDNQQMPDGTINEYTAAQQQAHLNELIAETAPLRYVDVDGVEYKVKVTGANRSILRYDWLSPEGEPSIQYAYMITIEQVS